MTLWEPKPTATGTRPSGSGGCKEAEVLAFQWRLTGAMNEGRALHMQKALRLIKERFGFVQDYLLRAGLCHAALDQLRHIQTLQLV